ncbi:MAG: lysoplasmalogenase [Chitinophagaceae bacterium]
MTGNTWAYLFLADLLAELVAIATGWHTIRLFTKPLLAIILFAGFMLSSIQFLPLRYYIAAALFFSWLGDVFLLPQMKGNDWFMAGLGSFLLAHAMYILFFLRVRGRQQHPVAYKGYLVILLIIYAIGLFVFLYPYIENLRWPVALYAITIIAMLVTAIHAFKNNTLQAARYCITGAALFVVSDSLLALNKFYQVFPGANIAIMLTYGLAQVALTKGSLQYLAGEKQGLVDAGYHSRSNKK